MPSLARGLASGDVAVKYLPTWFPGAGFHNQAAVSMELSQKMRSAPYNMVKKLMVRVC